MTRFGNLNKQCSAAVITAEDTTANMLGTARDITVHDFTGHFSGDVYDQTQTDSSIKDGDVLDLGQGNVAIMVKAWPTIVVGEIEHFHTLESGSSFDTLEAGKYAGSAAKAREVASEAHNNGNLQPVNSRFAAGDWMHLFEVGGRETECRVAIDCEKGELLLALERVSSMAFQEIRGARFRDLAESVIYANEAHKDPEEHGLERSSELPAWAAAILVERDQVSGNVQDDDLALEEEMRRMQREHEEDMASEPQIVWREQGWQTSDDGLSESKKCVVRDPDGTFISSLMTSERGGKPVLESIGEPQTTLEAAKVDAQGRGKVESASSEVAPHWRCCNCSEPSPHPDNGCVLHAFVTVLRERGTHSESQLENIYINCNVDRLWDQLGGIIDDLGNGRYLDNGQNLNPGM